MRSRIRFVLTVPKLTLRAVQLVREDIPSFYAPAASQGSNQPLDDGSFFVGLGAQPYFTEYAPECVISVARRPLAHSHKELTRFKPQWHHCAGCHVWYD